MTFVVEMWSLNLVFTSYSSTTLVFYKLNFNKYKYKYKCSHTKRIEPGWVDLPTDESGLVMIVSRLGRLAASCWADRTEEIPLSPISYM